MSDRNRFYRFGEALLHSALIIGAVALAWMYWNARHADDLHQDITMEATPVSAWQADSHRLFLFLSPTCTYCDQSMPLYARLSTTADSLRRAGNPVALAAVMSAFESERAQRHTLASSNVAIDTLFSTSLPEIGVLHVPTVTLVEPGGEIVEMWVGLQEEEGERHMLSTVRSLGAGW